METVENLDPEKTIIVYNRYKLNLNSKNKNGTSRWRCKEKLLTPINVTL